MNPYLKNTLLPLCATLALTLPDFFAPSFALAKTTSLSSLTAWHSQGDVEASYLEKKGGNSPISITHASALPFQVTSTQTITAVPNGIYTLLAHVRSTGGQRINQLEVQNEAGRMQAVPIPKVSAWFPIVISGIDVTNGTLSISYITQSKGHTSSSIDDVQLIKSSAMPYIKGVDASWLPAMEASHVQFNDLNGKPTNAMTIFSKLGVQAMRIRLFVHPTNNPYNGWCTLKDDIALAKRAKALGMKILLDFHYSDTWADPAHQATPVAWQNDTTIPRLAKTVYGYTVYVMKAFQQAGVTPTWVQIGNEINSGFLWPLGNVSEGFTGIAAFINAGYDAVKKISPTTKVIVHLANGWDMSTFEWFFQSLQDAGGHWDICGMSVYPEANDYTSIVAQTKATIEDMQTLFHKPSMIVETGFEASNPEAGTYFMQQLSAATVEAGGLGIFYWEPESYQWNGYTKGAWNATTKEPLPFLWSY